MKHFQLLMAMLLSLHNWEQTEEGLLLDLSPHCCQILMTLNYCLFWSILLICVASYQISR